MKSEEACQKCAVKPCGSTRCFIVIDGKSKQQYCLLGEQERVKVKKSLSLVQSPHPAVATKKAKVTSKEFLHHNECGCPELATRAAIAFAKQIDQV